MIAIPPPPLEPPVFNFRLEETRSLFRSLLFLFRSFSTSFLRRGGSSSSSSSSLSGGLNHSPLPSHRKVWNPWAVREESPDDDGASNGIRRPNSARNISSSSYCSPKRSLPSSPLVAARQRPPDSAPLLTQRKVFLDPQQLDRRDPLPASSPSRLLRRQDLRVVGFDREGGVAAVLLSPAKKSLSTSAEDPSRRRLHMLQHRRLPCPPAPPVFRSSSISAESSPAMSRSRLGKDAFVRGSPQTQSLTRNKMAIVTSVSRLGARGGVPPLSPEEDFDD